MITTFLFLFFLNTLAIYRVSHMFAREEGPFGIFEKTRDYFGQKSWWGRGWHCLRCISFWLALFSMTHCIIWDPWGVGPYFYGLLGVSIAGGVLILDKVLPYD